jgi:hypothetical protein
MPACHAERSEASGHRRKSPRRIETTSTSPARSFAIAPKKLLVRVASPRVLPLTMAVGRARDHRQGRRPALAMPPKFLWPTRRAAASRLRMTDRAQSPTKLSRTLNVGPTPEIGFVSLPALPAGGSGGRCGSNWLCFARLAPPAASVVSPGLPPCGPCGNWLCFAEAVCVSNAS